MKITSNGEHLIVVTDNAGVEWQIVAAADGGFNIQALDGGQVEAEHWNPYTIMVRSSGGQSNTEPTQEILSDGAQDLLRRLSSGPITLATNDNTVVDELERLGLATIYQGHVFARGARP